MCNSETIGMGTSKCAVFLLPERERVWVNFGTDLEQVVVYVCMHA
jgi:hypothetical protein